MFVTSYYSFFLHVPSGMCRIVLLRISVRIELTATISVTLQPVSKILDFDALQMTTDEGSAIQRMCFICLTYSFIISDVRMRNCIYNGIWQGSKWSYCKYDLLCMCKIKLLTKLIQNKDQVTAVVSCSRPLI